MFLCGMDGMSVVSGCAMMCVVVPLGVGCLVGHTVCVCGVLLCVWRVCGVCVCVRPRGYISLCGGVLDWLRAHWCAHAWG